MTNEDNPLLEAYVIEKEREAEETADRMAKSLRMLYKSFRKSGFTATQSMDLAIHLWDKTMEREK